MSKSVYTTSISTIAYDISVAGTIVMKMGTMLTALEIIVDTDWPASPSQHGRFAGYTLQGLLVIETSARLIEAGGICSHLCRYSQLK